jgi:hypothetical protein
MEDCAWFEWRNGTQSSQIVRELGNVLINRMSIQIISLVLKKIDFNKTDTFIQ